MASSSPTLEDDIVGTTNIVNLVPASFAVRFKVLKRERGYGHSTTMCSESLVSMYCY